MAEAVYKTVLGIASDIFDDDVSVGITGKIVQLPARFGGCNLLSQSARVDQAYVGSLYNTLPLLCNRSEPGGRTEVGFADIPDIIAAVGEFNEDVEKPFTTFCGADLPASREGVAAFNRERQDQDNRLFISNSSHEPNFSHPRPEGPLSVESFAEMEYPRYEKCQREITHQSAKVRGIEVERLIFHLPSDDPRRMAYMATDGLTRQKVSTMPVGKSWIQSNSLFRTVWQNALGLKLTICRGLVRRGAKVKQRNVWGTHRLIDAYGAAIANAPMEGGGWTRLHDSLLWTLERMATAAGLEVRSEVVGLLRGVIPQIEVLRRTLSWQHLRNIIPDLFLVIPSESGKPSERFLLDLKTLHTGGEKYKQRQEMQDTAPGIRLPQFGVTAKTREESVPNEDLKTNIPNQGTKTRFLYFGFTSTDTHKRNL